jgi:tetratricopeptide (TPR) repeat protein
MNKYLLQTALSIFVVFISGSNCSVYAADIGAMDGAKGAVKAAVKPNSAVIAMQVGRDAIVVKDWDKAIAQFKLASVQDPRNADAFNMLAYSYRKHSTPDLAKAFENYNQALKLDSKHKGAHEYIGEAYLMDNKPVEAEKHLALLAAICGNKTCEEYKDLEKAIMGYYKK